MFEFALLFGLLAAVNFIATIPTAGTYAGTKYLCLFVLCLASAPLLFTYTIHLFDELFILIHEEKVYKNMWLRSAVASIVALAIGAALSFYFVHPFIQDFRALESLSAEGLNAACYEFKEVDQGQLWVSNNCTSLLGNTTAYIDSLPLECVYDNQTSHVTWILVTCYLPIL